VGCDCDRYLEIWNLVFMQYNRDEAGNLTPLPNKNIDTGMGLERLSSVVQRVPNDFETDLFRPIIDKACELGRVKYGEDPKKDMAVKVISDHIRASAFMIADGILPTNDNGGYVLRRLIRRSARYGKLLGIDRPFLTELLPSVRKSIGDEYTELVEQACAIEQILKTEEERFTKTLSQGSDLLESEIRQLKKNSLSTLPGSIAFVLYDTYGFPLELTEEMCEEDGINVDKDSFNKAMDDQRERARASSKQTSSVISKNAYTELADRLGPSSFCGYDRTSCDAKVIAIIFEGKEKDFIAEGESADIVLSDTPFYGEKGGQVGDTGVITAENVIFEVEDTIYPVNDLIVHRGRLLKGSIKKNQTVTASIDVARRKNIQRHHTATHLVHEALSKVLGQHVRQAGSIVTPTFLRFDFNHFAPLTTDQLREVESIVYEQVLSNLPVNTSVMPIEDAKKTGAKALFDEKYGDEVRVLEIPGYSSELCGGTHVKATGEIGVVKIIREEGIGSGVRRINAIAGQNALQTFQRFSYLSGTMMSMLGEDLDSVLGRVEDLLDEKKILERKNRELQVKAAMSDIEESIKPCASVNGVDLIMEKFENMNPDLLRQVGDRIKQKYPVAVILLAGIGEEKHVTLTSMASEEAVSKGIRADEFLKEIADLIGGRGGGRPTLAQGRAPDAGRLNEAITKAPEIFARLAAKG
jgi:alanyl-tRNA synthetase